MNEQSVPPKGWRQYIKIHPACDLLPPLPADQLRELADDIQQHGLVEPIRLTAAGAVLDGRHRLDALEFNGETLVDPATGTWTPMAREHYILDDTPPQRDEDFLVRDVIALNIRRRQLSEQDRVALAFEVWKTLQPPAEPSTPTSDVPPSTGNPPQSTATPLVLVAVAAVSGAPRVGRGWGSRHRGGGPEDRQETSGEAGRRDETEADSDPGRAPDRPGERREGGDDGRDPGRPNSDRLREGSDARARRAGAAAASRLVEVVTAGKRFTHRHPDQVSQLAALWRLLAEAAEDGSLKAERVNTL